MPSSSSSSSPTARLFADLDVDRMNMNAEDIDRLLRDGLTSMGLADLLEDGNEYDVESSSPRDIATSGTTSSGPSSLPQPRPSHMEVLSQIGAWNCATSSDNDGTSPFTAPETDDDFILTSVGVTTTPTTSGITAESTSSTTLSSIFSTGTALSATSSSAVSDHYERIVQQLLLSSPGYNSSVIPSSTSSSSSGDNDHDGDLNDEDDVLSNEITRLFGLGASLLGSGERPDSTASTNTTTSTSTTSTSTSTSTSAPSNTSSDDEANTNGSGSAGKSPTSVAKFPSPTAMIQLDRHCKKILDDLREQMRPLEEAHFLEYGMAWYDLLDTVLSSIYPLADVPDPARGQGQDVQGQDQVDEGAVSPVPMRHYQPLLLECARVWRRSLQEAIERNKAEMRMIGEDGKAKYYSNSLLRRKDRHFLVQQAARIVERYLHLHQVFPEDKDADATSAEVDADTGSKVRTHICVR